MEAVAAVGVAVRALTAADLDAVVAIDATIEGRSRRDYFARRLAAAVREPTLHAQLAASDGRGMAGYILARVLEGEFGRSEPGLRLEVVGVSADAQGKGIGRRLFDGLAQWAGHHGIRDLRTQAAWNDHRMLRWLDAMGFVLAPNHVVDCAVRGGEYASERDDPVSLPDGAGPANEIDYGGRPDNDFERLARDNADVRAMTPGDLADIVRIDRGIGHALLSQLFANLGALRIERVETVVAPRDLRLLGFLYSAGFAPSQRLPFVRRLDARNAPDA